MLDAASRSRPAAPLEVTRHAGDLDALAPAWTELCDPGHPGAAFRSWAWSSAWWKTFSTGREPFVLLAREAGRIVGILPLYAAPTPLGGRRLGFIGEGIVGSDYLGAICRAPDEARVCRALAAALGQLAFDELCLDGLDADDPLLAALTTGAAPPLSPGRVAVEPRYRCPHIRLHGDFDRYLDQLPDGTGAQWRRRLRWLERQPGFALEVRHEPDAVVAALDTLFALHHERWSIDGGSDAIDGPAVEAFHRRAARALAERGWARLGLLFAGGAVRAALYGFRHGDRFAFYQAGYDLAWRQRSVGTVLLGHMVRRASADGLAEFDFLRGSEPYKLKWANGARFTVRLRARDGSLRAQAHALGRTAYLRLREAGKRALPPVALDWARRTRRKVTR